MRTLSRLLKDTYWNMRLRLRTAELVKVIEAQHNAIDILFAQCVALSPRDNTFYPSKSEAWPAAIRGAKTLQKYKFGPGGKWDFR